MDACWQPDPHRALVLEGRTEGYFLVGGLMKWSIGHCLNGPVDGARYLKRVFDRLV
jgi:hypothetical protein